MTFINFVVSVKRPHRIMQYITNLSRNRYQRRLDKMYEEKGTEQTIIKEGQKVLKKAIVESA